MVGEIRDLETADIAIKAAQTGHLVLSTLHTNDAPTTLTRLLNMGVAPFNVASSVILITAQRLGRKLCTPVQEARGHPARGAAARRLHARTTSTARWQPFGPVGCDHCKGTRLQGSRRHLPGDADHRRDAPGHHAQRQRARHRRAGAARKACATCASRACSRSRPASRRSKKSKRSPTSDARIRRTRGRIHHGHRNRRTARRDVKEYTFIWEGVDRSNRQVRGESKAASETVVTTNLRRQGIRVAKIKRQTFRGGKKVTEKDITFFTRQLATMLKAGVPLLQSFDIVARGHSNARFSRLMMDIKNKIETGSSMSQAFREHPASLRHALLQPGRRGRGVGHARRDPRPPRDVQGKDPRDQEQDQVGAVLPDLGDRGGDRGGVDHHGLRDPGVQEGVHELRRRPARADADRDGDLRLLRGLVVA